MAERISIHSCPRFDWHASSIRPADASLTGDGGQVFRDIHAHAHWKPQMYFFSWLKFMRYSDLVIRSQAIVVDQGSYHCLKHACLLSVTILG